ncbi:MAG: glycosyltransferase, partial [Planctomycetes bacterium]|nr:glycosyltransferase [Planctomycetota bacterium]
MGKRLLAVHITEAFNGGIITHLEWAARSLPARGIDLHCIVSTNRSCTAEERAEQLANLGARVSIADMVRSPSPLRDIKAYGEIKKLLAHIAPDIVHTHSAKAGFLGRRAAYELGLKCVHTPHVFPFEWAKGI